MVGGELTMDNLELKHNAVSNVSEASLQLKSNCGCLLIDDFGRQRVNPVELLNRWIVPLENRVDYLTLASGKKIEVPFEQLIIFSTNLEPHKLADDAFLRRIPFKIEIGAPSIEEFHKLFQLVARHPAHRLPGRDGRLSHSQALHGLRAAVAALPRPRFARANPALLRIQRAASDGQRAASRPCRSQLFHAARVRASRVRTGPRTSRRRTNGRRAGRRRAGHSEPDCPKPDRLDCPGSDGAEFPMAPSPMAPGPMAPGPIDPSVIDPSQTLARTH